MHKYIWLIIYCFGVIILAVIVNVQSRVEIHVIYTAIAQFRNVMDWFIYIFLTLNTSERYMHITSPYYNFWNLNAQFCDVYA